MKCRLKVIILGVFIIMTVCSCSLKKNEEKPELQSVTTPVAPLPVLEHKTDSDKLRENKNNSIATTSTPISQVSKSKDNWEGEWNAEQLTQFSTRTVSISNVNSSSFEFVMESTSGCHMGSDGGVANIEGNTAVYNDLEHNYKVLFTLDGDIMQVKEDGDNSFCAGTGIMFSDNYIRGKAQVLRNSLKEHGILESDLQEQEFKKLTGEYYDTFINSLHYVSDTDNLDNFDAEVYECHVLGMYQDNASIIMINNRKNQIWAAVLDVEDFKIRYFTNTADKQSIPLTIKAWVKDHDDREIVISSFN